MTLMILGCILAMVSYMFLKSRSCGRFAYEDPDVSESIFSISFENTSIFCVSEVDNPLPDTGAPADAGTGTFSFGGSGCFTLAVEDLCASGYMLGC